MTTAEAETELKVIDILRRVRAEVEEDGDYSPEERHLVLVGVDMTIDRLWGVSIYDLPGD